MSRATRRKAKRVRSDFLTPPEAAAKWGVSEQTVRRMCEAERVPGARNIGTKTLNRWLIPKAAFPRGGGPAASADEYAEGGVG